MPEESQVAMPLQVERSTVTKLVITGAPSLDPITVFLEDLAPCKGKITVSCWGKSWTAYWGGMWDGLSIGQFFCELNTGYIIGYFDQAMRSRQFSAKVVMQDIIELNNCEYLDELDVVSQTGLAKVVLRNQRTLVAVVEHQCSFVDSGWRGDGLGLCPT